MKRKRKKRTAEPAFPLTRLAADKGLSLNELAKRTGIAREYLSAIANGRCRPLWSTVVKLAAALGASLGEFDPPPDPPAKKRRNRLPVIKDGDLCSLHA